MYNCRKKSSFFEDFKEKKYRWRIRRRRTSLIMDLLCRDFLLRQLLNRGGSPQCERSRELHFRKYEDREGEFDCESV